MWDKMFSSVDLLQKGLDATWLRNEVISNNIANIDTPGYKSYEVNFEELMAAQLDTSGSSVRLSTTNERHLSTAAADISEVEPVVTRDETTSDRLDGNNVDIEMEMVALAKNSIEYYSLVNKINSEFRNLNKAINIT